jgi:hypothetical protein
MVEQIAFERGFKPLQRGPVGEKGRKWSAYCGRGIADETSSARDQGARVCHAFAGRALPVWVCSGEEEVRHGARPGSLWARAAAATGLGFDPTFNLARFHAAELTDDPYYLAWLERVIVGMRKAGVPEG